MPFLIQCPSCAARLKSPQPVPAGREVVCPKCKTTFTLTAPAPEIGDAPPAPVPPPLKPRSVRAAEALPAAVFVDDDDRPPVKKRRDADDDDDRLRARKRPADDANDDPPRSRKNRAAAEPDADDEFTDDEPRRGRSKKGSKKVLVLAAVGVAAVFLLCGGAAVMYFVDPFGLFGGAPGEMTAWIPADARAVVFRDVEAAEKVEGLDGLKGVGDPARYGVRGDEVSAILAAGRLANGADPEVVVIKLKSAADRKKIIDAAGGIETTAGDKTFYRTRAGAMYFASDRLLVGTRSEPTMTLLLTSGKNRGPSAELKQAMKNADGIVWLAGVGEAAELGDTIGLFASRANPFNNPFANRSGPKARATALGIKASGNIANIRFESTYDTSEVARQVADALRTALNSVPKSPDQTFDVSTSGSSVILKLTGPLKRGAGVVLPFGF